MSLIISAPRLLCMTLVTLLLSACASSTKLTTDWTNPNLNGAPFTKVAVIAIANDEGIRRYAEDQMVAKIPKSVVSVAGYTMFNKPEKNVDVVREQLIKNGFNGVLVMRLVKVDKSEVYVPPQTYVQSVQPYSGYYGSPYNGYNSFNGYYGNAYNSTYVTTTPGYTKTNTNVIVESMFYRLPDGALMWTGTTDTLNPDVKTELVDAITNIVESKINQPGLLGSK